MIVPSIRVHDANDHALRDDGQYVLYWMIAQRRTRFNFGLQHAVQRAIDTQKPLLILEALRVRYRWASDRLHRFVIEGMRDNAAACATAPVTYYPYVEPKPGVGSPLLFELARRAVTVVTDEYPCFFLPRMIEAVRHRIPARLELVDSNGIIPLRLAERTFTVAHSFRRWMQKNVLDVLDEVPLEEPLQQKKLVPPKAVPDDIISRWPAADFDALLKTDGLSSIPIDHSVVPSPVLTGGQGAMQTKLERFLDQTFSNYDSDRNHPDEKATSGMSSYLHFGHLSSHEFVHRIFDREQWSPQQVGAVNGKNHSFWNLSKNAEAILDQILTWRELGFNMSFRHPDTYATLEKMPDWAKKSMAATADDPRPFLYDLETFETAATHDEVWNAAQREIVQTGVMHNYMRMLWGKKILHWTQSPEEALRIMIHLNNKYGLDGRDPNSYSGIFWVLGRYDRAWGPKRDVFGSIRYMTSDSARKKLRLEKYLQRFGPVKN